MNARGLPSHPLGAVAASRTTVYRARSERSSRLSFSRLGWTAALAVALTFGSAAGAPQRAEAQPTRNQVEATPKGTIGLGLVGAELGFVVPALAGLDQVWAFIVFPIIGAAGGAVGGYFAIDSNDHEELAVAALAFGMAMVIPSLVITLSQTAYDPEEEAEDEDLVESGRGDEGLGDDLGEDVGGEPAAGDEFDEGSSLGVDERIRLARAGGGLLRLSDTGLRLGVPAVRVAPMYSDTEVERFGVTQRSEIQVPLFSGLF